MASSGRTSAVKGGTGSVPTPANNLGGDSSAGNTDRRRSSSSSRGLFSGLMDQKRTEWSGDAAAQARRDSFNDQKPQAGIFGTMWNNFTGVKK